MLIVEWLMRLPGADGMILVEKTCTNAMTDDEAVGEATTKWTGLSVRERMPPDGFQIVDQDGRVRSGPCFAASTGYTWVEKERPFSAGRGRDLYDRRQK